MLNFIYVLIGLGAVIFVHELGHFLAARAVGIKVNKFALGFGPRLFGIVRGGTDYCVNALPIGGYVAMMGQEDFKANETYEDPGAYPNRPVWARMIVISAGVVMNLIFAALVFVVLFMIGLRFVAPIVGDVNPTMPAAKVELPGDRGVGLQPGDRILSINGKPTNEFQDLLMAGLLAGPGEQFVLGIERPLPEGGVDRFDVNIVTAEGDSPIGTRMAMFGIGRPPSNELSVEEGDLASQWGFENGDVIVECDGTPIEHGWQLLPLSYRDSGDPVDVRVRRDGQDEPVTISVQPTLTWSREHAVALHESEQTPPNVNVLGLLPRLTIAMVAEGSPAEKAGVLAGDLVVSIGDPPVTPSLADFKRVLADYDGRPAPMQVLRNGEVVSLEVGSSGRDGQRQMGVLTTPEMAHLVVANVMDDSPLAGQVPSGATILAVQAGEAVTEVSTWSDLVASLKNHQGESIALAYQSPSGDEGLTEPLELTEELFAPSDLAFALELPQRVQLTDPVQTYNPITAAGWGVGKTVDFVLQGYMTLNSIITGKVDPSNVSGPVGIFRAGMKTGEDRGFLGVVQLFGMISALLAVFNFLPLPILDGGHAVLLVIEQVRGKPVSMKVQNAIQMVGLVAFIGLFLLITFNDIFQWLSHPW